MRYRHKPCYLEVMRYNGQNAAEVMHFIGDATYRNEVNGELFYDTADGEVGCVNQTLYITKDIDGRVYTRRPEQFEELYEPAE